VTYRIAVSILASLFVPTTWAGADDFYKLVRYQCSPQSNRLSVSYDGAYDDAGRAMVESAGPDAWDTEDLVILDRKIERRTGHKTIRRQCVLSSGAYDIVIEGFFWNADPAGECGYATTAFLRIVNNGKNVYAEPFEAHCSELKNIVTDVSVQSDGSVAVKQTSRRAFFKW
jgi:hypothetical protein